MKKLKVFPYRLEIRSAEFPAETSFKAVKLSFKEAMDFKDNGQFHSIEDLIAVYGADKVLNANESYDGYIAVVYSWGRANVVRMNGFVTKVDPKYACGCLNSSYAELIRDGRAWEVCFATKTGTTVGAFQYVWTFRDCCFQSMIVREHEQETRSYKGIDAEVMDKTLKDKLVAALVSSDNVIELTDEEDMVLRHYLGNYYKQFFAEVN